MQPIKFFFFLDLVHDLGVVQVHHHPREHNAQDPDPVPDLDRAHTPVALWPTPDQDLDHQLTITMKKAAIPTKL
jgi:hypothetical protein